MVRRKEITSKEVDQYTVSNPDYLLSAMLDELLPQMNNQEDENGNDVVSIRSPQENFCETNVISVCNASDEDMQKHCSFYAKPTFGDHCMFLHSEQFCDNPKAQEYTSNLKMN